MKLLVLATALAAVSTAAVAEAPEASCIDPHKSYVARPLNHHDVFVQTSLGKPKPPVRITTSCSYLDPAIGFGFGSQFTCVGLGDSVTATINGGGRETCVVTHIAPYAPEKGDLKQPAM